jgi:hypothetical protein
MLKLHLNILHGLYPCTILTDWFCITEVESLYCAVRTESSYKKENFVLNGRIKIRFLLAFVQEYFYIFLKKHEDSFVLLNGCGARGREPYVKAGL